MSFDLQPTLKGELLGLRPLRPEDLHDLYAVASDPLIWEQHPVKDRYKEEVFKGFFREALECGGTLIAIDSKDGQVIGSSRFHGYDKENSEIEIGWTFLARSHWGGIYNREMKQLMLRHAFKVVNRVIFLVGPRNLRSQKAVEKIGGVRAGSRPDAGGRESFVYQITAATSTGTLRGRTPMKIDARQLRDFGERYTAAWCSQDPERVAAFFSTGGSLSINGGAPAAGRDAIREVVQGFMTAFPDLVLTMDDVRVEGGRAVYHWTIAGANTGPGGTGQQVLFSGFESWEIGADGLIAGSLGHFDEADYQRQLERGTGAVQQP